MKELAENLIFSIVASLVIFGLIVTGVGNIRKANLITLLFGLVQCVMGLGLAVNGASYLIERNQYLPLAAASITFVAAIVLLRRLKKPQVAQGQPQGQ